MDFKTLGDRLHDAIDTIIRRDESTESETGNLLVPCIEGDFFCFSGVDLDYFLLLVSDLL